MSFHIIKADDRVKENQGAKILLVGRPGVGKTSLLRTLDHASTLFIDNEAGGLSVTDVPVDTIRPKTWPQMVDLAVWLGGPNPAMDASKPYSQAHYDAVMAQGEARPPLEKYRTFFIDSITEMSRVCFRWCQQQPEAFNKHGAVDLLGAYGLLAREMLGFIAQIQHARGKSVVFVGIMENVKDAYGSPSWELQIEGGKTGRELPGIVDEVITMEDILFEGEEVPAKVFVCQKVNPYQFPAKDRSGKLDLYEPPHLGNLIAKVTANTGGAMAQKEMSTQRPAAPSEESSALMAEGYPASEGFSEKGRVSSAKNRDALVSRTVLQDDEIPF